MLAFQIDKTIDARGMACPGPLMNLIGAIRQNSYGNVNVRNAVIIGVLSPLGVLIGVGIANHVSERVLQLSFAALALFIAYRLLRRALAAPA